MNDSEKLLLQMLEAIREQTAAINRLVELQATLIAVLADEQDPDAEPTRYMDGSLVR